MNSPARAAAALLMVLALVGAAPAAAQPLPLRYAQAYSAAQSIYSLPVTIAQRQDFFRREGLDFKVVVPIPGGSDKMIAALHDDTADLTHVATPFLIRAALAGSDAVAVAAEFDNPVYSLVAQPQVGGFADLKGKVIGFADAGGTIAYSMRRLLAQHGLGEADYSVKVIEGTGARFACLTRGACAAVPLGQPDDFTALEQGYRILGDSTEAVPAYLYTVTAARRGWAQTHAEAVTRYVRALAAAFRFIRDPANRAEVVTEAAESTGCSEAAAARTLARYLDPDRHVLPRRGELDLAGLAQVIGFMGETGAIAPPLPDAGRFVDARYLHAAGVE